MRSLAAVNSTNVRLISILWLLLTLSACGTTTTGNVVRAGDCPREQLRVCESFASERYCRCANPARVVRTLVTPGSIGW